MKVDYNYKFKEQFYHVAEIASFPPDSMISILRVTKKCNPFWLNSTNPFYFYNLKNFRGNKSNFFYIKESAENTVEFFVASYEKSKRTNSIFCIVKMSKHLNSSFCNLDKFIKHQSYFLQPQMEQSSCQKVLRDVTYHRFNFLKT